MSFVRDLTKSIYKFTKSTIVSRHVIVLANIPRDVLALLELADVHQWNKVDLPFVLCAFLVTSFHSSSTAAFASGVSIASGERSFARAHVSRA